MARCVYCHSVVAKGEDRCYVCGDKFPKYLKAQACLQSRNVSGWTNLAFLASLAFTLYCFLAEHKLSLTVTLVISSALLLIRILADRLANKSSH